MYLVYDTWYLVPDNTRTHDCALMMTFARFWPLGAVFVAFLLACPIVCFSLLQATPVVRCVFLEYQRERRNSLHVMSS